MDIAASPWWAPARHADRRPFLRRRGRIVAAMRGWFADREFLEVETPVLQVSPANEAHLHGFATELVSPAGEVRRLYLRTSPEFACKKLLAAGERRIVEFARVFRNRERGALHHPEFTLVEWYRAEEPYEAIMDDCVALLRMTAETARTVTFSFRGRNVDPFAEPERLTVADAFQRFAGIDLLRLLGEPAAFAGAAKAVGVRLADDDSWSDIFSRVLVERIEPQLGIGRPTLLYEYPLAEAALARPASDDRVAERFELYACGVELANGFGELTDPAEQRRRFQHEMDEKARVYGERYPVDEDFLAALTTMPPASGVALGLDRLVMLAAGAQHIEQVLWAPVADL